MSLQHPLHAQFMTQRDWCVKLDSPFYAELLEALAAQLSLTPILRELLAPYKKAEERDAIALRLLGALHALVLKGDAPALAAQYPNSTQKGDAKKAAVAVIPALTRHKNWVVEFLKSPPQTNSVGRTAALLPGFIHAQNLGGPLHTLEIGASAGLLQYWDRYLYQGEGWAIPGDWDAPMIAPEWTGAPPDDSVVFNVASRAGCDLSPLDIREDAAQLALAAYVWPDQPHRLMLTQRAIEYAAKNGVQIDKSDAADWLTAKLSGPLPKGVTVIYHSITWQYFSAESAAKATAAIEDAGARADAEHQLVWLRFETQQVFGDPIESGFLIDSRQWPGDIRTHHATAHPHGKWVKPLLQH